MPIEHPSEVGVEIEIDGRTVLAREGELVIEAAGRNGVYIPHFCWHPRMTPVGMCRMCIAEIDTGRGYSLQPTCMVRVSAGMSVRTESEATRKAQEGVLEFLLINHPLDCPVCDKGGECPLQDQTMSHGPGESRFVEDKRHHEKPIPISELILLDRERCILCDRCTRFAREVAGDPFISFQGRGHLTEVNIFDGKSFDSYFSGNVVQICPVGALTSVDYRFKARPWDLEAGESTCQTCALGCRVALESSRNRILRISGVDSDPVNWGWLCDKGRYGFTAIHHGERLAEPMVAKGDALVSVTWGEAVRRAADAISETVGNRGPGAIGVIGGSRLTNEDVYAWVKLMKGFLGCANSDAGLGDDLPPELVVGMPGATIDDVCASGTTILLVGPDPRETVPVLFIRLREALATGRVRLIEITPVRTSLSSMAEVVLRCRPGEEGELGRALFEGSALDEVAGVASSDIDRARHLIADTPEGRLVVLLGRSSLGGGARALVDFASSASAGRPDVRFLPLVRRPNLRGAIELGMAPALLPGRVTVEDGREWYSRRWPAVPDRTGSDVWSILERARDGEISVLILLGADLFDVPDRRLALAALETVPMVVALDLFPTETVRRADVVLPCAGFAEKGGTTTNLEGRVTTLAARVTPPGAAQPDWVVASELAACLGFDLGFSTVQDITNEISSVAPAHLGLAAALERCGGDGVVLPLDPPDDAAGVPPLYGFTPGAAGPLPPLDRYSFRLVATRRLYDTGTLVSHTTTLAGLTTQTVLRVNPYDFDRLGVERGEMVRCTSVRGVAELPIEPDPEVPRWCAAVHLGQPDADVTALLDGSSEATDLRIETLGAGRG
ncbi:MAG: NADH-quinone oxidoreductase subunit G [Acidimicrobiales bacterium]|nr:MAG: NADH-quinone oxidoreductase subunit G [Acidimicrobiales bacterium]